MNFHKIEVKIRPKIQNASVKQEPQNVSTEESGTWVVVPVRKLLYTQKLIRKKVLLFSLATCTRVWKTTTTVERAAQATRSGDSVVLKPTRPSFPSAMEASILWEPAMSAQGPNRFTVIATNGEKIGFGF